MNKLKLNPEQLIVINGNDGRREDILKIYFSIFNKKAEVELPPAIAAHVETYTVEDMLKHKFDEGMKRLEERVFDSEEHRERCKAYERKCFELDRKNYFNLSSALGDLSSRGANYILLDGNHRANAAALAHKPLPCIEIANEADFEEMTRMDEAGELINLNTHNNKTFRDWMNEFYQSLLSTGKPDIMTLWERTNRLVESGEIPKYMIEAYKRTAKA